MSYYFTGDHEIAGRDILRRIENLEEYEAELETLRNLDNEITEDLADVTLRDEDDFGSDWAREQARDILGLPGTADLDDTWPFSLIDWYDAAGERLEELDYEQVYYEGTYYRVVPD